MEITCQSCGAEIPASDIALERAIAKCPRCNNVFSIADKLPPPIPQAIVKPNVALPKQMKIEEQPNELRIYRKWWSNKMIVLIPFAVFWDGFMVAWYSISLSHGQWGMAAFGTIHLLVGICITYYLVGAIKNTTLVRVNQNGFDVSHGPIPFPGINRLVPGTLDQVYCKEKVRHGKGGPSYSYEVYAVTKEGKEEKIVSSLATSEQALFMEQAIEKYLGIKDRPMPGEMRVS